MKTLKKRALSWLLVLLFVLTLVPAVAFSAFAQDTTELEPINEQTEQDEAQKTNKAQSPVTITNGDYSLTINKTVFEVGEPIMVSATGTDYNTWVGIYSAKGAKAGDSSVLWQYVRNVGQNAEFDIITNYAKKEDTAFEMPNGTLPEGEYVIRLFCNSSSNANAVMALVHIRVGNPPAVEGEQGILSTDKRVYKSGEAIMVSADLLYNDTWVGIYGYGNYSGSSITWYWVRDHKNVAYNVATGRTLTPGLYMIRLCPHDGNGFGNEAAYTLIVVEDEYNVSYLSLLDEETPGEDVGGGNEGGGNEGGGNEGGGNEGGNEGGGNEGGGNEGGGNEGGTTPDTPTTPTAPAGAVTVKNGEYELSINKTVFNVGDPILVSGKGPNDKDWIGIYRVQDNATIMYQYLGNVEDGAWFDLRENCIPGHFYNECSSLPAGEYVIRLQANAGDNLEDNRAVIKIKIGEPETTVFGDSSLLSTDKTVYKPGEPILVTPHITNGYTDSWVGIYSFNNFHKNGSIEWEWVKTYGDGIAYDVTEGKVLEPGIYLIRLLPYDTTDMNTTLACTAITVEGDTVIAHDSTKGQSSVSVSNGTHTLTVNKTKFNEDEEILISANYVSSLDWIGIAERGSREAAIRWYYIAGNEDSFNIRDAKDVGGTLGHLAHLPSGLYTIYLVENNKNLINSFTLSINISIGDVEDSENGAVQGGSIVNGSTEKPSSVLPPLSAEYVQNGTGYAGGYVTITMPEYALGNYNVVLYWADANGALEGYSAHARFKVMSIPVRYTFSDSLIIPNGATRLLIYSQEASTGNLSEEFVSIDLPQNSGIGDLGAPITSFFAISDVHIGSANGIKHFKYMLNEAIRLYPNGAPIFVAGDVTDNGYESQYVALTQAFDEVMAENGVDGSKYPLFIAIGNHDYPSATGAFLSYATLPDGTHPSSTNYDFWLNGYHYIFLGTDGSNGLNAYFNQSTLTWLDQKLSECRDGSKPTFIFLHQPLYNTVSGSLPGEGWHGVTNDAELRAVLANYPEVIMFNGHTHWEMNSVGNMFEGTAEFPIHIFNCASVSYLWSGFNKITGENMYGSHGYAVDVYGDKVIVRGRDFVNQVWISSAQYVIELGQSTEEAEHSYVESLTYANGYMENGLYKNVCSVCGCGQTEITEPLFEFLGYSTRQADNSLCVGYNINRELLTQYEALNGTSITVGLNTSVYDNLVNKGYPVASDGTATEVTSGRNIIIDLPNTIHSVDLILRGDWSTYGDLKLNLCAFIIENGKVGYICSDEITEAALPVTYAQIAK